MFGDERDSAFDIDNSVGSGDSIAWHSAAHITWFRFASLGVSDNLTEDISNSEGLYHSVFAYFFLR